MKLKKEFVSNLCFKFLFLLYLCKHKLKHPIDMRTIKQEFAVKLFLFGIKPEDGYDFAFIKFLNDGKIRSIRKSMNGFVAVTKQDVTIESTTAQEVVEKTVDYLLEHEL